MCDESCIDLALASAQREKASDTTAVQNHPIKAHTAFFRVSQSLSNVVGD